MKKFSLSIFALAIALTACNEKESFQNNESGEPVLATFKITSPSTYAPAPSEEGTADENKITVVEFYMFDAQGQRDETTGAYDYSYHKYTGNASSEISFMVKSGIGKKLLVAVNTDLGPQSGKNYSEIEQLIEETELSDANSQWIDAGKFIMSGKQTTDIIENSTENEVTISISRLASKIEAPKLNTEFVVSIPNEDLQEVFADETVVKENIEFTLNSYAVINGYNKSYVFTYYNSEDKEYKEWDLWSIPGGKNQKTTFDASNNDDIKVAYSGMKNDSYWLNDTNIFVYENQPEEIVDSESGITGYEKDQVYAFLINGTLTNTVNNESVVRYWRVNLIRDDNYSIYRNTIYRVTLDEVRTIGYGTAKEAEEDEDGGKIVPKNDQTAIQATIEIVAWRVKVQNTDF